MYCPVCLNDTLKLASSGVVKFSFNGKAKATSQFYYNIKTDSSAEVKEKLDHVIKDYFIYYSGFQNKDSIEEVEAFSIDFKCENKCVISVGHRLSIIGILFDKESIKESLERLAKKYQIPINLKL